MPLIKINELTDNHLQMIEDMGGTGFPPGEIAEVIEVAADEFIGEWKNKDSLVYKRYRKGQLQAQLQLRQRIFKDAGFGSSPAQTLASKIMEACDYKLKEYE